MKTTHTLASPLLQSLIALQFLVAPFLLAQDEDNAAPFFFRGGNPQDFILAIDEHYGLKGALHELAEVHPDMGDVHVPKIRMQEGSPFQVLEVYKQLSEDNPRLGRLSMAFDHNTLEIHSLSVLPQELGRVENPHRDEVHSMAYNLGAPLWSEVPAVEERLDAFRDFYVTEDSPLAIQLHQPSGLLMVRGTEEEQRMIQQLLEGLRDEHRLRLEFKQAMLRNRVQIAEMEQEYARMLDQREALERELQRREENVKLGREEFNNGTMPRSELENLAEAAEDVHHEIKNLQRHLERMEAERKLMNEELKLKEESMGDLQRMITEDWHAADDEEQREQGASDADER